MSAGQFNLLGLLCAESIPAPCEAFAFLGVYRGFDFLGWNSDLFVYGDVPNLWWQYPMVFCFRGLGRWDYNYRGCT